MIVKQVTNDKDITSFYDRLTGATCAYGFIKKEAARLENLNLIQTLEKARELAPAFSSYLSLKEVELGKSRKLFTELEKEAFTKEFMEINKLANNILGFKGEGNLKVKLVFAFIPPKSWSKKKQREALEGKIRPSKSDIDNYIKSTLDSLNNVAYKDDRDVYKIESEKKYDIEEYIEIEIEGE